MTRFLAILSVIFIALVFEAAIFTSHVDTSSELAGTGFILMIVFIAIAAIWDITSY